MPNLNVTLQNEQGQNLNGVACTLLGTSPPQFQATAANGQCSFQNLAAGSYRLLTALEGFNTKSTPVTMGTADFSATIIMNVVNEDGATDDGKTFWRYVSAAQYIILGLLGVVFAGLLIYKLWNADINLSDNNSARGLITFLVAVVTVAIALILVMAAFMSGGRDVEKRFAFGKEVLTILIGVLGTVMGFYYGQAAGTGQASNQNTNGTTTQQQQQQQQQSMQVSPAQLEPAAPALGTAFTLRTKINGGQQPYRYTVTFNPPSAVAESVKDAASNDGNISQKFTLAANPDLAKAPVTYKIDVKDAKGATATFDQGKFTPPTP